jgi:hypothetical protein
MQHNKKEPLYRKVNRTAHGMKANHGGDFSTRRNTKGMRETENTRLAMSAKERHGYDYTPLFRFLLSKVGQPWDEVQSEALSRLDKAEPLFWLVAQHEDDRWDKIRIGESSYYSGLYVDEAGLLQKVAPELNAATMRPTCSCCTHTFNGVKYGLKFEAGDR